MLCDPTTKYDSFWCNTSNHLLVDPRSVHESMSVLVAPLPVLSMLDSHNRRQESTDQFASPYSVILRFRHLCPPPNIQASISSLETCLSDIQTWVLENKLKLNDNETEAPLMCTSSRFLFSFQTHYHFCLWLWNLFFSFCQKSWFPHHKWHECRTAHKELLLIELCYISTIQHLLSVDCTKTLLSASVLSVLDYCNSLPSGCPKHLLEKLWKVQNWAARLILKAHKQDQVSPLLRTLHWLPIQACIKYKLSTLCHSLF